MTGKPATEATKEQRDTLVDQLVAMTLAAQAAEKDGAAKDPEVQARLDLIRTQVLAEAASEKYSKAHPVSDDEVKAEYDAQVATHAEGIQGAAHPGREEGNRRVADPRPRTRAVTLPSWRRPSRRTRAAPPTVATSAGSPAQSMVKPFADALATLEKGGITKTPVQTQYGWHVIQLEDTRAPQAPAFEDVKEQVKMLAQRKKLQAYLDELRKTAKIQKTG